jgi:orotate phosphoribosyltransferase-like protein
VTPLAELIGDACDDLRSHWDEFDAVVCAGDFHGVAMAAVVAAVLDKPLMIVCRDPRNTVSLIVPVGALDFHRMRYLYVDDAFTFGESLAKVFAYLDSSGTPAPVVATYEVTTRTYARTGREVPHEP